MTERTDAVEHVVKQARFRDRAILFYSVIILGMGQSMMFIIAAPLARDIGLSEIQYGLALTLANLSLVVAGPFWGRRSDAYGRKPILIIGALGCTFGNLLLAWVLQLGMWGAVSIWPLFFLLVVARTFYGTTSSAIYSASAGFVADTTDRASRAQGMALMGGANSLGIILGPAVAGGLAFISLLFPMYFVSGLAAVAAIMAYFFLMESRNPADRGRRPNLKFTDPRLLPFLILRFGFWLTFISLNFITAFFVADRLGITGTKEIAQVAGMALLCQAATSVFVQTVVLQFIKIPHKYLLRLCLPFLAMGFLILAFAHTLIVIYTAYILIGLASSLSNAGIGGGASLSVEPHEQGVAAGYTASATTLGLIIAPLFGTALYAIAPAVPMLTNVALLIPLSIYALFVKVSHSK